MTDRFRVVPAVYVVLLRDGQAGTEVLLQLRQGTTYMDGHWACAAAGHLEAGESITDAAIREASEELGIGLVASDLELAVTSRRTCVVPDEVSERIDLFLIARRWVGEPYIAEPDKAGDLRWWPLTALPERTVPHERAALRAIADGATPAIQAHGFDQHLTLIAAVGRNGVIGDGATMPWHLPADLRFFKEATTGGTMLMGRGTWDSIGRALPGRRTIVVTRQRNWTASGAEVAHGLREALALAGEGEVFIAGGGQIYSQTIEHARRLLITEVDLEPEGSARFPDIDPGHWHQTSRSPGESNGVALAWVTYERTPESTG